MKRASLLLFCAIGILACCISRVGAFDEKLEVRSRTLTDSEFVGSNQAAGTPVTLSGSLSAPDIEERLPVVILLHSGDGPRSGAVWNWSRFLNSIGIATF